MAMTRREFMHTLAVAAAAGFPFADHARAAAINGFYDLHGFGNNVQRAVNGIGRSMVVYQQRCAMLCQSCRCPGAISPCRISDK